MCKARSRKKIRVHCNQCPGVFLCQEEMGLTGNMKVLKHYSLKRT